MLITLQQQIKNDKVAHKEEVSKLESKIRELEDHIVEIGSD